MELQLGHSFFLEVLETLLGTIQEFERDHYIGSIGMSLKQVARFYMEKIQLRDCVKSAYLVNHCW